MLRKFTLIGAAIGLTLATVQPAIARPMTSAETAYLSQMSRMPEYRSVLAQGVTKQSVIDIGWRVCKADENDLRFYLLTQFQWLKEGNAAATPENLIVSMVGGAVAIKHLCPEQRSTYGETLNSLMGIPAKPRQVLWALTR